MIHFDEIRKLILSYPKTGITRYDKHQLITYLEKELMKISTEKK